MLERVLKFRIPNTFIYEGSQSYGLTFSRDRVEVEEDLSPESVLDKLDMHDETQPVAVRKRSSSDSECRTSTSAIPTSLIGSFMRNVSDLDEFVCIQEFCKLPRLSSKATLLRLHYAPSSVPVAYQISNRSSALPDGDESELSLTRKFCVSCETSPPESLLVYKVVGKSIEEYVETAKKVLFFMENFFKLRLEDVVIDLVGKRVVQVKSFQVKSAVVLRQVTAVKTLKNCYVCKQGKEDLPKVVTYKMISECFQSLKNRGIQSNIFDHMKRLSDWATYKCCDICYSLILNEQDLNKIALRVFKSIPFFLAAPENGHRIDSQCSGDHLRIFISIDRFENLPNDLEVSKIEVIAFDRPVLSISGNGEGFVLIELFRIGHVDCWAPIEVRIFDTNSVVVGAGCLSSDFVAGRLSSSQLVSIPIYLGRGKWNLNLTLGIQVYEDIVLQELSGEVLIRDQLVLLRDPLRWLPVPDDWLPCMKAFKKRLRRRRSRSNSRDASS